MADKIEKTSETTVDIVKTVTTETRVSKSIFDLKQDIAIYTESRDSWQTKIGEAQAQIDAMITLGVKE